MAVVADSFVVSNPLQSRIEDLLCSANRSVRFHCIPNQEPDTQSVADCLDTLWSIDPDLIVAIGGGSAMDTAKVARILLPNPGSVEDMAGWDRTYLPHESLFVCVPTTAGTASEVSEMAVISLAGSDIKLRYRSQEMAAQIALLDPELLLGLPANVTANTGLDAITHALESYVSRLASPLTDPIALDALKRLVHWLPTAYNEPENVQARSECLLGSMQAGFVFNSTQLGLVHAISAPIGAIHHIPHGLANALVLPAVTAFNESEYGGKRNVLLKLFKSESVYEGVAALCSKLNLDIGLDPYFDSANEREIIATAALKSGNIPTNLRTPTIDDVLRILDLSRQPLDDDVRRLDALTK